MGNYDIALSGHPETGAETELNYRITRARKPVDVEPYLGAGGHLTLTSSAAIPQPTLSAAARCDPPHPPAWWTQVKRIRASYVSQATPSLSRSRVRFSSYCLELTNGRPVRPFAVFITLKLLAMPCA